MILKLAIEQARSQKRYTAWTAAFIALTLGLVTYAFALIETERGFDSLTARAYGLAGERLGYADVMTGNPPESSRAPSNTSTEAIDAGLDAALADGSDVVAVRTAPFAVVENASSHVVWPSGLAYEGSTSTPYIGAVKGAYEWDLVLAEGEAPGPGEIALSARLAADLGVGIGDPVLAHLNDDQVTRRQSLGAFVPEHPLVVSGLLRSNAGLTTGPPWEMGALVSWELSNEAGGLFTIVVGDPKAPEALGYWGQDTLFSYDRSSPALTQFGDLLAGPDPAISMYSGQFGASTPVSVYVLFPLAAILILGSFIGAFAVGRSQGQARVQWVATARTLGATRCSVRLASLAEAGLVAALGTVVGFSLGYGAAMIRLLGLRSRIPAPLAPTWVPMPWWVLGIIVSLGLALGLIMGAAPAFWASRIPPVAAQKTTADLAVVETSRRVPIRWLWIPFAIGVGLILTGGDGTFGGTVLLTYGGIVAIPIAFVFLIEGLRHLIPLVGRRLARSRSVWAMVAGDSIASRPRQASTLAALASIAGLFGTFLCTIWILGQRAWFLGGGVGESWSDFNGGPLGGWDDVSFGFAVGFLVAIQAICLAVTLSSLRVTAAEQATRQALGLTPGAGRAAAFAQHAVPQIVGGAVGGIVGVGVAWFIYFGTDINYANYSHQPVSEYLPAFGYSVVSSLAFAAIGLAIVGAGSVFASHAPKERTPIEALQPAGKVFSR